MIWVSALDYKWIGKNVNLNLLVDTIEGFLQSRKFKIRREDSKGSYQLLATFRSPEGEVRSIEVKVSGTPNDFTVQLRPAEQTHIVWKLSPLVSFFGGGALLSKKLKSTEFYQRFEEDFWRHLEIKVFQLADSERLSS